MSGRRCRLHGEQCVPSRTLAVMVIAGIGLLCSAVCAQEIRHILSLPALAEHLEAIGVRDDPVALARDHTAYAFAARAAVDPFERMNRGSAPWLPRDFDLDAYEGAARRADDGFVAAERALLDAIAQRHQERATEVRAIAAWRAVAWRSASVLPAQQAGYAFDDPLAGVNRAIPSVEQRRALRIALAPDAAALAEALRAFRWKQMQVAFAPWSRTVGGRAAGTAAQHEANAAARRAIESRWRLEQEIEARLPESARPARRGRFLRDALGVIDGSNLVDGRWVEPGDAGAALTLLRLRAAGALTMENQSAVMTRLDQLAEDERNFGSEFLKVLIRMAPPDPEDRSGSYFAALEQCEPRRMLRDARRRAVADLARTTGAAWLLDSSLPQPRLGPSVTLTGDERERFGELRRLDAFWTSCEVLPALMASPPMLRSSIVETWLSPASMTDGDRAVLLGLLRFSEDRFRDEVATRIDLGNSAAIELAELEAAEMLRTQTIPAPGDLPAGPSEECVARARVLASTFVSSRVEAWQHAIAVIDEFSAAVTALLDGKVESKVPGLLQDLARIDMAWRLACEVGVQPDDTSGGMRVQPLAAIGLDPFTPRAPPRSIPGEASPGANAAFDPSTLDFPRVPRCADASMIAAAMRPAADAISVQLNEVLTLKLKSCMQWARALNEQVDSAEEQRNARRRQVECDARMVVAWTQAEAQAIDALAALNIAESDQVRVAFIARQFPKAFGPMAQLIRLRSEIVKTGVDAELYESTLALVEPEFSTRVTALIDRLRQPLPANDEKSQMEYWNEMGARSDRLERDLAWLSVLAPTPAWVLARTLAPEVVERCPSLRSRSPL